MYHQIHMKRILTLSAFLGLVACGPPTPEEVERLINQQQNEISALIQRQSILESAAANCDDPTASPPPIFSELHQILRGDGIDVSRDGSSVLVTLTVSSIFRGGSMRLKREAAMALDMLSTALKIHDRHPVTVIGHTDNRPTSGGRYASNLELSAARAAAIVTELTSEYGVPAPRFTVAGRGEHDPIADNDTTEGRDQNRRVVVEIHPSTE